MKMKKSSIIFAIALVALVCAASCTKQGGARFRGNYSFKTSGYVDVVRDPSCQYDTTILTRRDVIQDTIIDPITRDTTFDSHLGPEYKDTLVTQFPDSSSVSISTESGQMDITEIDGDKLLVTMNCTGGDLVVYYATASGDVLTLEPSRRKANMDLGITTLDGSDDEISFNETAVKADILVSGTGRRYDNIILFDLTYEGSYKYNDILYDICGSSVHCRAKEND